MEHRMLHVLPCAMEGECKLSTGGTVNVHYCRSTDTDRHMHKYMCSCVDCYTYAHNPTV